MTLEPTSNAASSCCTWRARRVHLSSAAKRHDCFANSRILHLRREHLRALTDTASALRNNSQARLRVRRCELSEESREGSFDSDGHRVGERDSRSNSRGQRGCEIHRLCSFTLARQFTSELSRYSDRDRARSPINMGLVRFAVARAIQILIRMALG